MSAPGYTALQLYRTTTAGAAPASGNMAPGELAININDADMALYAENASGVVKRLINNPAGLKYPTADGSAGQVVSTDGAGNLTFGTVSGSGLAGDPRTVVTQKNVTFAAPVSKIIGTVDLSATVQVLFVADGNGASTYAVAYDSSTDTMGSPVAIGDNSGGLGVYKISSTQILIGSSNTATLSVRVLSISGTTITANTAATWASSAGYLLADPILFGSSYVFRTNSNPTDYLIAATISGTTVTLGSSVTVGSSTTTAGKAVIFEAYTGTTGFTSYIDGSNNLHFRGFSVSGTTITLGADVNTSSTLSTYFNSSHLLSNGKFIGIFANGSTAYSAYLISMSGTTVTQSGSSVSFYNDIGSACLGLVSNTSVLFVSSAGTPDNGVNGVSAIVWRDNAGTIAASSVSTVPISQSTPGFISITQYNAASIMVTGSRKTYNSVVVSVTSNAPSYVGYALSSAATPEPSYSQDFGLYSYGPSNSSIYSGKSSSYLFASKTLQSGQFTPYAFSTYAPVLSASGKYYRSADASRSYSYYIDSANNKAPGHLFVSGLGQYATAAIDKTAAGHVWYCMGDTATAAQKLYRVKFS